jgi:hypothetical protein
MEDDWILTLNNLTKDDLDNQKYYPAWICSECGGKHGKWPDGHIATFHIDICGWCNCEVSCTEPRDFGYPEYKGDK